MCSGSRDFAVLGLGRLQLEEIAPQAMREEGVLPFHSPAPPPPLKRRGALWGTFVIGFIGAQNNSVISLWRWD